LTKAHHKKLINFEKMLKSQCIPDDAKLGEINKLVTIE